MCIRDRERITDQIISKGLEEGVLFYPGGTGEYRDIVCLGPPYIIGDEEIDLIVDTLEKALNQIQVKYS